MIRCNNDLSELSNYKNLVFKICVATLVAVFSLSPAVATSNKEAATDFTQAETFFNQGHRASAKPLLLKLANSRYANKQIFFMLAECYQSELDATALDIKLSEQCARKALALDPEFGCAYRVLSQIALRRDQASKAIELSTRGLTCKEPDPFASYQRSKAYSAGGEYVKALADIDLWLKTMGPRDRADHRDKWALQMKGDLLYQLGRTTEALVAYRKALPFKRELTTQSIINCLKSQRKFTEAIAECSKLIQENPKDEQAFGMRAALESSNHDDKGALRDYTKAISLMPTSRYFKERAKVYEKLGQADLARKDLVLAEKEY